MCSGWSASAFVWWQRWYLRALRQHVRSSAVWSSTKLLAVLFTWEIKLWAHLGFAFFSCLTHSTMSVSVITITFYGKHNWAPDHHTHLCLLLLILKFVPLFSASRSFGKRLHSIFAVWLWVFIYQSISKIRRPDAQSAFQFIPKGFIGVKVRVLPSNLCKPCLWAAPS